MSYCTEYAFGHFRSALLVLFPPWYFVLSQPLLDRTVQEAVKLRHPWLFCSTAQQQLKHWWAINIVFVLKPKQHHTRHHEENQVCHSWNQGVWRKLVIFSLPQFKIYFYISIKLEFTCVLAWLGISKTSVDLKSDCIRKKYEFFHCKSV